MTNVTNVCIVLASSLDKKKKQAELLADKLALPICTSADSTFKYHLVYTDHRLELHHNPHLLNFNVLPVFVDFLQNRAVHHRLSSTTTKDPLPKAVGIKPGKRPYVVDATAGMGMDGMQLSWLGCKVTLIERSPIVHALLQDGLERARQHKDLGSIIDHNISLLAGDSTDLLLDLPSPPHTVVVDPMYPDTTKGPRNKKEMRILRDIVGKDDDTDKLFTTALQVARNRVVLKRPKHAPVLDKFPLPSHQIVMKSGRFDVYLVDHL